MNRPFETIGKNIIRKKQLYYEVTDDTQFVSPIDWNQIEKDRQKLIDGAYEYIINGRGKGRTYLDINEKEFLFSSDTSSFILKFVFFIILISCSIYGLSQFYDFSSIFWNLIIK